MGIFQCDDCDIDNVNDVDPLRKNDNYTASSELNVMNQMKHVSRIMRGKILGRFNGYDKFRGCTIWMTGLSGAGKTSIAFNIENYLVKHGIPAYGLDGDNMRTGLNKNLGFSKDDRRENIRRVAEVAKLFADSGHVTLCSFVSPFENDRAMARKIHEDDCLEYYEIFVDASLNVCENRDVKGLYKKARQGVIKSFTGIGQNYEIPRDPDLILNTETMTLQKTTLILLQFLNDKGIIPNIIDDDDDDNDNEDIINNVNELFINNNNELIKIKNKADKLNVIDITKLNVEWLQVIAEGWASPLKGFMRQEQYLQILQNLE